MSKKRNQTATTAAPITPATMPSRSTDRWAGAMAVAILASPLTGGKVARQPCREHMICPLPRASEMSAFRAVQATAMVSQGGDHGLRRGCGGAGDEGSRGHHASVEWGPDLAAGGGHPRDRSPQPAPVAGPV